MMMTTSQGDADAPIHIPLNSWMEMEMESAAKKNNMTSSSTNPQQKDINSDKYIGYKESFIRRTTVAYGIAELLKRSHGILDEDVRIDNFVVSVTKKVRSSRSGDDIKGVGMITAGLSVTIEEPSYLSCLLEGEEESDDQIIGRYLEVELTSVSREKLSSKSAASTIYQQVESNLCHLFARLLYELFTNEPFPDDALAADDVASTNEPAQKKAKSNYISSRKKLMLSRAKEDFDRAELPFQMPSVVHMQKLGIPASICLMTQNLLECALKKGDNGQSDDAYESFGDVCADLHLLLLDPDRFLFDDENQNTGNVKLLYRRGKLYGRDKEETLITDAFCRVSRGKSEAFFIGGFSGSGKSMLVNSLTDRVDVVGGYVIKHKFDPMSREKPLSGVISAFNQICQMIKDRRTRQSLDKIGKKLRDEFGVDFSLLMRLLPNVSVLCSEIVSPMVQEFQGNNSQPIHERESNTLNARSVCYTLLRFMRVVSSPHHPIMLFLDDLQWADSTALDVIHAILSDTMGSCMFFVGTYRDNEVQADHDLFDLIEKLEISNVPTTKVSLTGLDQNDLNAMISDALCLYPRICKPLSGIVSQKTKGSPFFVLEFIESLRARGLLQYNFHQKRWVWNMDIIRGEEITDNVLHLLSLKMSGLSDDVRTLLKVMACFGTSTNASVIGYLSESVEYSGVRNELGRVVGEGFIEMDGGGNFNFAHDKVREAAYDLIPDSYKKQFHYDLGKLLYSICDGRDVGDTIFLIASQINHGKESIQKDKDLSIAVAKLNMKAGKKAVDGCDHKTAYSYFDAALSLLPEDNWESYYDLSLELSFLLASAANSCCLYCEAELILRGIFGRARCFEDQLSGYFLLSQIFQAQGEVVDAYNTCSFVLLQLGESIPDTVAPEASKTMVKDTLAIYDDVYNDDWLERKMEDKNLRTIVKFYGAIVFLAYLCKSRNIAIYFICKAVQLSLRNGACEYTPHSLLQLIGFAMEDEKNAARLYRIARIAMSLLERFDVGGDQISGVFMNFYGRIAWHFEPFQVCGDNLRRGFESGLSSGSNRGGFHCAFHVIKTGIISGEKLASLLKEIDYCLHLLKTYKSELIKNALLISRETVSALIDKGHATSIEAKASNDFKREPLFFHQAFRAYWQGHGVRCHHFFDKCSQLSGQYVQLNPFLLKFYHGLNSLDVLKKKKSHTTKYRQVVRDAISALTNAADNSDWNFTNKLRLLEAEQQSLTRHHLQAIPLYDASITCAKRSGFIHEEGLACEKAGLYCKREKNDQKALEYFIQARKCYEEWGSRMKVEFIQKELDDLYLLC